MRIRKARTGSSKSPPCPAEFPVGIAALETPKFLFLFFRSEFFPGLGSVSDGAGRAFQRSRDMFVPKGILTEAFSLDSKGWFTSKCPGILPKSWNVEPLSFPFFFFPAFFLIPGKLQHGAPTTGAMNFLEENPLGNLSENRDKTPLTSQRCRDLGIVWDGG